jgi:DNA polymerase-1
VLDVAGVVAKFGVPPDRIVDYLTLIGDTVDNVPGVDKVGPKTAAKWIAEHGSLDGVIAARVGIKGVAGENLRKALDWLPTGRRLITVVTDCDLAGHVPGWPALEALALRRSTEPALLDFYQRYGFRTWRKELEADGVRRPRRPTAARRTGAARTRPRPPLARDYETCSLGPLDAWLAAIQAAELVALDTETDSLDGMRRASSASASPPSPAAPPTCRWRHDYPGAPDQLPLDEVLARCGPGWKTRRAPSSARTSSTTCMSSPTTASRCAATGTTRCWRATCSRRTSRMAWRSLAERHLGRKGLSYEDLCGKGAHQIPFSQVDIARATPTRARTAR